MDDIASSNSNAGETTFRIHSNLHAVGFNAIKSSPRLTLILVTIHFPLLFDSPVNRDEHHRLSLFISHLWISFRSSANQPSSTLRIVGCFFSRSCQRALPIIVHRHPTFLPLPSSQLYFHSNVKRRNRNSEEEFRAIVRKESCGLV